MSSDDMAVLSPEQREVVVSGDARLAVSASAGSGKTRVLAARFLHYVADRGYSPDRILTLTFTRKAAADMKRRIVRRLREAGLTEFAQVAETGPIQTIHSFCERVLRENALAADVDPEFRVLADDAEGGRLRKDALRAALPRAIDGFDEAADVVELLAGAYDPVGDSRLHGRLAGVIWHVVDGARAALAMADDLGDAYGTTDRTLATWRRSVASALGVELGDEEPLLKALHLAAPSLSRAFPLKDYPPDREPIAAAHVTGLAQLAVACWREYDEAMEREQAFDFGELERRAVRLLEGHAPTRRRLRETYPVLLVDECQDVNRAQFRLMDCIDAEHELIVGDGKQSIYAFRGACPALFDGRLERASRRTLRHNHRTEPGILRFIDATFAAIWPGEYVPACDEEFDLDAPELGFDGVEHWVSGHAETGQVALWVADLVAEGHAPEEIAVLVRERETATRIGALLDEWGVPHRVVSGAERFAARLEVRDVANALLALTDPSRDYTLLALLGGPFVGLSLDGLVLLAAQSPVVDALPNFVPPDPADAERLETFRDWFDDLRQVADRMPAVEVMTELLRRTSFFEELARRPNRRQSLANVRKLLTLASQETERSPGAFAAAIQEIRQLGHRMSDAPAIDQSTPAVTLMTIHSAKGLEFDVVVLPDLDRRRMRPRDVLFDGEHLLLATKWERVGSIAYGALSERSTDSAQREAARLLYVAMTRARKKLCLCLPPVPPPDSMGAMLARASGVGKAPMPGVRVRHG